jgi:hypothetical protein
MKIFELALLESSSSGQGKMFMGMLVQTPEQFVKSEHAEQKDQELDEDDSYQPVKFIPKAQYSGPQTTTGTADAISKPISPDEIAQLMHGKNSYVIYHEVKAPDDPSKIKEKRVTTQPVYIDRKTVDELNQQFANEIEAKFPDAKPAQKKLKVYTMVNAAMAKLAVQQAIQTNPEVKQAIQNGIDPKKLKAKQFTTQATKVQKPMIHKSSIPIVDDSTGEVIYDLDKLAASITKRPQALIKANEKMLKSGGNDITIGNFGIPAITGLVVDEKSNEFRVITTCPGAGTCMAGCYVGGGNYIKYAASSETMMRALNYIYNDPNKFKQQMITELKALVKPGVKVYLRWHDAGDFFSKDYLHLAFDVARAVPDATIYAYTKNAWVVNDKSMPNNFIINFSQGAKPVESKQIDFTNTKYSQIVPEPLFKDEKTTGIGLSRLQNRDPEAQARMKQVIAQEYKVDPKTILTYDEMLEIPEDSKNTHKFNVIIVPGLDGDLAAARRDILGSYLLEH